MKSVLKKIKTISKVGLDPFLEGKKNYENPTEYFEVLAKKRAEICAKCPLFQTEPNELFAFTDARISVFSNKMCGDCGCALPLKTRQNIETCKHWKNL